jgi:hypothetical protein
MVLRGLNTKVSNTKCEYTFSALATFASLDAFIDFIMIAIVNYVEGHTNLQSLLHFKIVQNLTFYTFKN